MYGIIYSLYISEWESNYGIRERTSTNLSKTLNCSYIKIPFKYLGMPTGGNLRKQQFFTRCGG